jgi:hypothetical protein
VDSTLGLARAQGFAAEIRALGKRLEKVRTGSGRLSALARAENGPLEQFTLVDWFVFGQSTMDVLLMVRQVNTVSSVLISSTLDMDV